MKSFPHEGKLWFTPFQDQNWENSIHKTNHWVSVSFIFLYFFVLLKSHQTTDDLVVPLYLSLENLWSPWAPCLCYGPHRALVEKICWYQYFSFQHVLNESINLFLPTSNPILFQMNNLCGLRQFECFPFNTSN